MSSNPDYFLLISSTGWAAIASITAIITIITALFLPYFQQKKILNNLRIITESELQKNIALLTKANSMTKGQIEGKPISRINLMCPVLININLNDWNNHGISIAEKSPEQYLNLKKINDRLYNIKDHAIKITEAQGNSPYVALIENEVTVCLQEI